MANPVDDRGNVRVDHVWGNMPMQPDDQRPAGAKLDPTLDNHIVATSGWNGFPAFIPGEAVYQDTIANAVVPNVLGLDSSAAANALLAVNLVYQAAPATITDGATVENDGTVATQSIAANTVVNESTIVTVALYEYVAP